VSRVVLHEEKKNYLTGIIFFRANYRLSLKKGSSRFMSCFPAALPEHPLQGGRPPFFIFSGR
jgi:hypothetical protein